MQPAPPAWSKNTVMPIDAILNSQWTAYNRRKQAAGADPGLFDYTAAWEVNYLGRLIRRLHPHIEANTIRAAMKACSRQGGLIQPRAAFVTGVMSRLKLL